VTSPSSDSSSVLAGAAEAVALAQRLVDAACAAVRANGGVDANQVVAYDVAHAAAAVATARSTLQYGERGDVEAAIANAFVADVVADLTGKVAGREALWGVEPGWAAPIEGFLQVQRDPAVLAALATTEGRDTWARISSWCARPSTASRRRRCGRTRSTCTGPTTTSPGR